MAGSLLRRADRWVWLVLIAPFVLVSHLLNDLHSMIVTFHGTDEGIFHFPVILHFSAQLPFPDVGDYASATTPLFHIVFSLIGELVGFELYKLRAFNAFFSFLATLVYYRIWRDQFELDQWSALLITLAFLVSPYFFGVSFILLTDNLAWLFCLLALYGFLSAMRTGRLLTWSLACLCLSLALLTRQTLLWLMVVAMALVLFGPHERLARGPRMTCLLLAGGPLIWLVFKWHGLVPPSFQGAHEAPSYFNVRAIEFTLAMVGLYFPLLESRRFLSELMARQRWVMLSLLSGCCLLWFMPVGQSPSDDGLVWRISRAVPTLAGSSVLFWLLIPVGAYGLTSMLRVHPRRIGTLSLLAFMLTTLPSSLLYQKYFDPYIPVFILLNRDRGAALTRREAAILVALTGVFVAYALLQYVVAKA